MKNRVFRQRYWRSKFAPMRLWNIKVLSIGEKNTGLDSDRQLSFLLTAVSLKPFLIFENHFLPYSRQVMGAIHEKQQFFHTSFGKTPTIFFRFLIIKNMNKHYQDYEIWNKWYFHRMVANKNFLYTEDASRHISILFFWVQTVTSFTKLGNILLANTFFSISPSSRYHFPNTER